MPVHYITYSLRNCLAIWCICHDNAAKHVSTWSCKLGQYFLTKIDLLYL